MPASSMTRLFPAVAVLSLVPGSAVGQRSVPDEVACPDCRVARQIEVRIGQADGPGIITGIPNAVTRDSAGRYWILDPVGGPQVFLSNGLFLGTIGREGDGPGEFRNLVDAVALPGDSVLLLDLSLRRATVIGPDLEWARMTSLGPLVPRAGVATTWPARLVLHGTAYTPRLAGWPLHALDLSGSEAVILESYGSNNGEMPSPHPAYIARALTAAGHGDHWSAEQYAYRLTRWTEAGTVVQQLQRNPDWFTGRSMGILGNPETPPSPRIGSIATDERGYLWVYLHVPAGTWKRAWPQDVGREISVSRIQFEFLYTTVLEVIDPERARVITRASLDGYVVKALPGRRAVFYETSDGGIPSLRVEQLSIRP